MKKLWVWSAVCVLGGAMAAPAVYAQAMDTGSSDALRDSMEKARIAEEIIAREEAAMGRTFDSAFRDRIRGDLAARSLEALAEVQKRGSGLLPGPKNLGDSGADLVYTPVTPCRIINTLLAGGPIAGGTTRSFRVTGTGFSGQGGTAGSCGVPVGATGAVINFVAVAPAGAGDLRYTPFGTPVPTASFLNYVNSGIPNDNIANGPTFPLCNPATTTCTNDFTIQADVSATNVVADVMGYFARPANVVTVVRSDSTTGAVDPDLGSTVCQTADFTPATNQRAFISGTVCLLAAGLMNFTTFPMVSNDAGATFNFAGSGNFARAGSDVAGVWACATKFMALDLTAGTQYRFGMQVGRDSGTADATNSRCETSVQLFAR